MNTWSLVSIGWTEDMDPWRYGWALLSFKVKLPNERIPASPTITLPLEHADSLSPRNRWLEQFEMGKFTKLIIISREAGAIVRACETHPNFRPFSS